MDYLTIGTVPANEDCQQVGANYDGSIARKECNAFINQLRREFGKEPEGVRLAVKSFPHDFGSYLEVVCYYSDDNKARDYAFKCESEASCEWDEQAKLELQLATC